VSERIYTPPLEDDPYRIRAMGDQRRRLMVGVIMSGVVVCLGAAAWNTYGGGPAPLITVDGDYKTAVAAPPPGNGETRDVYRVMEGATVSEISATGRPPIPAPLDLHPNSGGGAITTAAVATTPLPPPANLTANALAPAAAGSGYWVQLAALRSEETARAAWATMDKRYPGLLTSVRMDIQRADLGPQGVYYRLRAGYFGDRGQAGAFCDRVKGTGAVCMVVAK
jgi:cell division septation protein DedD